MWKQISDGKTITRFTPSSVKYLYLGSRCWIQMLDPLHSARVALSSPHKRKTIIALIDIYVCHMLKERLSHDVCRVKRPVGVYEILCLRSNRVLRLSDEMSMSVVHWDLALCLLLAWVMCYFCIWKGIKSTGKARNREHVWEDEVIDIQIHFFFLYLLNGLLWPFIRILRQQKMTTV